MNERICLAATAKSKIYLEGKKVIKYFVSPDSMSVYHTELEFFRIGEKQGLLTPPLLSHGIQEDGTPYIVSCKAEGEMLQAVMQREDIKGSSAAELAEELYSFGERIHSIRGNHFGCLDSAGNQTESWMEYLMAGLYHGRELLEKDGMFPEKFSFELNRHIDNIKKSQRLGNSKPTLVHGDFCEKNIFIKNIKGKWKVSALIDFENGIYAPQEYDFIRQYQMFTRLGVMPDAMVPLEPDVHLFYEICDYLSHIHNVLLIRDCDTPPYFCGKSFRYPDCENEYIVNRIAGYVQQLVRL